MPLLTGELEARFKHGNIAQLESPIGRQLLFPAPFETHTDWEMDILEKCLGRRAVGKGLIALRALSQASLNSATN